MLPIRWRGVRRIGRAAGAALASTVALAAGLAAASPCDDAKNSMTLIHFETGESNIPKAALPRLEQFSSTAKYKDYVCIFGQVDAQGGDNAANMLLARNRAHNIKLFLTSRGVRDEVIEIRTQPMGFTLWGLLDSDQPADRRVRLTHE